MSNSSEVDWVLPDASAVATSYREAQPFPHIVLSDLFPEATLAEVEASFPADLEKGWQRFDNPREQKSGYTVRMRLPSPIRDFLDSLSRPEWLLWLEEVTGIEGLIPDPYLGGGGIHLIERGGFLNPHTDFTVHPKLNLWRRLNVLTYLNRDWKEDYGGCLDLYDTDGFRRERVLPSFNTTVIFSTSDVSYHGHPVPVSSTAPTPRRSVSTYYYTAREPGVVERDTVFLDQWSDECSAR